MLRYCLLFEGGRRPRGSFCPEVRKEQKLKTDPLLLDTDIKSAISHIKAVYTGTAVSLAAVTQGCEEHLQTVLGGGYMALLILPGCPGGYTGLLPPSLLFVKTVSFITFRQF